MDQRKARGNNYAPTVTRLHRQMGRHGCLTWNHRHGVNGPDVQSGRAVGFDHRPALSAVSGLRA